MLDRALYITHAAPPPAGADLPLSLSLLVNCPSLGNQLSKLWRGAEALPGPRPSVGTDFSSLLLQGRAGSGLQQDGARPDSRAHILSPRAVDKGSCNILSSFFFPKKDTLPSPCMHTPAPSPVRTQEGPM